MHPLTYFDEEYGNMQIAISNMNTLTVQSKDTCILLSKICVQLPSLIKNTKLDAASVEQTLSVVEDLIHQCRELLRVSEESQQILKKQKM